MRLSIRPGVTHVGNVKLHEMSFVSELDAEGQDTSGDGTENISIDQKNVVIPRNSIEEVERNLAIVIPCMNEDEHVLRACRHLVGLHLRDQRGQGRLGRGGAEHQQEFGLEIGV